MSETTASSGENKYRIIEALDPFGNGKVFKAQNAETEAFVVFKRVSFTLPPEKLPRWRHPHLIRYLDSGADTEGPFLVTEWIEGMTLKEAVQLQRLSLPEFYRFAQQLLTGYAHAREAGLIHGDIHSGNIIVNRDSDDALLIKLVDFDLSQGNMSPTFGSLFTMAPERFDAHPVDELCDLYSMGAVFYYVLTGIEPFAADTEIDVTLNHLHHRIAPLSTTALPLALNQWIDSLMALHRTDRPKSALEALTQLKSLGEDAGLD